jgi:hypothetical protein
MDNDLQQAITLIRSGNKKGGGQLLAEIVKKDPRNINAWLWLSACVNSDEQRIYCFKKVLEIDPANKVALSALSKLQQIEPPTEKEILGEPKKTQQSISNPQPKPLESTTPSVGTKKSAFQPKFLTAVGGMGIMVGTVFPWATFVWISLNSLRLDGDIETHSGLTTAPGILTAIIGLAIVFIAIFQQTKPGKANSLISSLFALVAFLMACLWKIAFTPPCFESSSSFDTSCYTIEGFGYVLSMSSLVLTFIFGLIPNPKE